MMKKINVAIIGYGNIGRFVVEAVEAAEDMAIAGIVRRNPDNPPIEIAKYRVVNAISNLREVDVAIICAPSRKVEEQAVEILSQGINTVDSFDVHPQIVALRAKLDAVAKKHNSVAITSAGWDPGSDSVVRALLEACAPKGITYTNFGPGMSMGHSVAARAIEGVKDAISVTIPTGAGVHRRMVYVELAKGADFVLVSEKIKKDDYFAGDQTDVVQVGSVDSMRDMGHRTHIVRKGVSGATHNQHFEFDMQINNPALTAQILVSSARATMRQSAGAYTMIEIAPIDLLMGERDDLIARLV